MKTKNVISSCVVICVCLLISSCEPGYNRNREGYNEREAEQSLMGNWYVNGDPNKRAEIVLTSGGLEARNENGDTSRLEVERGGEVRALDWGGLRGNMRSDRIAWDNGTTWTRESPRR